MNTALDEGLFLEENRWDAARVLEVFDSIFDVLKPTDPAKLAAGRPAEAPRMPDAEIEALIEERNRAKKSKNFARADEIRGMLLARGIALEDTKEGIRWKRK